jgi:hypothetical protein
MLYIIPIGYSRALYNISILNQDSSEYLNNLVEQFAQGWMVNFTVINDSKLELVKINVPRDKLVIGLANGWAGDGKFLLILPSELQKFHLSMQQKIKGYAFWNILDEGLPNKMVGNNSHDSVIWMSKGLNRFLKIRDNSNRN